MKTTLILACLFILVLVGGYFLHRGTTNIPPGDETPAATTPLEPASNTGSRSAPSKSSGNTTQQPGTYTMAQVATHNSSSSCWTVIQGKVYNLTAWISQHPGGEGPILSICGTDGSAAFNAQHGGNGGVLSILATFKIGTLAS